MDPHKSLGTDRELIEQVQQIIVKDQTVDIHLIGEAGCAAERSAAPPPSKDGLVGVIGVSRSMIPMTVKGILHSPTPSSTMPENERDVLLTAIAKARAWIDDLVEGRVASFAEIAQREGKVERHIRLLAPLAFVSPPIILDIANGVLPRVTVTDLAKTMPYCWAEQLPALRRIIRSYVQAGAYSRDTKDLLNRGSAAENRPIQRLPAG